MELGDWWFGGGYGRGRVHCNFLFCSRSVHWPHRRYLNFTTRRIILGKGTHLTYLLGRSTIRAFRSNNHTDFGVFISIMVFDGAAAREGLARVMSRHSEYNLTADTYLSSDRP